MTNRLIIAALKGTLEVKISRVEKEDFPASHQLVIVVSLLRLSSFTDIIRKVIHITR